MSRYWLGLAIMCGAVGCGGNPLPHPGKDMTVHVGGDMAGGGPDMSMGDLGPLDMTIPDDAIKPVLYSQFASDYAAATCAHLHACGQVDNDPASQAACREIYTYHFGRDIDAEVMRGHVIVNELQCLDAISNSRCDGSDSGLVQSKCYTFLLEPLQQPGQACISSDECVNGYCLFNKTDAGDKYEYAGCPGICATFKTTNCDTVDSCGPQIGYCLSGTCYKYGGDGDSCASLPCKNGFFCGPDNTCHKPAMQMQLGGACVPIQGKQTSTPPCAPGMYCKYTNGPGSAATCQTKIAAGAQCNPQGYAQGFDNPCVDGTHCDATATPNPVCNPYGGMGATCVAMDLTATPQQQLEVYCKTNFYCSGGHCVPRLADGQPCTPSDSCLSDVTNYPSSCRPANPDAGAATTCQPYRQVGASCTPGFDDNMCYPGGGYAGGASTSYCAPDKNGGGSCAPKCQ